MKKVCLRLLSKESSMSSILDMKDFNITCEYELFCIKLQNQSISHLLVNIVILYYMITFLFPSPSVNIIYLR